MGDSSIERGAAALDAAAAPAQLSDAEVRRKVEAAALLTNLAYARQRKELAKEVGVGVQDLDKLVNECRTADATDALPFEEVEPWGKPVEGATLLTDIVAIIQRYAVLDRPVAVLCALWCVLTQLVDHATVLPILAITSPEKGCGKTTLLALIGRLVRRAILASNITAAALFRSIGKWEPTLLIDEADSFLRGNEELRGVLNSGHTRATAYVIRCVGDDNEPHMFPTYCPKAIALIGKLPDTLYARSVPVPMRRKSTTESAANLRHADPAPFRELQARAMRWAADNGPAFAAARPVLPEVLDNRLADNAEPLVAIADLAGGPWPEEVRRAVLLLVDAADDSPSVGEELLCAIQSAFAHSGRDRLSSVQLLNALNDDPEARWATFERGRPMTPRSLARRLAGFEIRARVLRIDGRPLRGYELSEFADAFVRYLPAGDVTSQPASSDVTSDVTATPDVTVTAATEGDFVTGRYATQEPAATPRTSADGPRNGVTDASTLPTGGGPDAAATYRRASRGE